MKINFQKILATVSAVAVMFCFSVPAFAVSQLDMDEIIDSYVDVSPDEVVDGADEVIDGEEEIENSVSTTVGLFDFTDNLSPFIESAIIVLCAVGGITLGTRFLKKSFR